MNVRRVQQVQGPSQSPSGGYPFHDARRLVCTVRMIASLPCTSLSERTGPFVGSIAIQSSAQRQFPRSRLAGSHVVLALVSIYYLLMGRSIKLKRNKVPTVFGARVVYVYRTGGLSRSDSDHIIPGTVRLRACMPCCLCDQSSPGMCAWIHGCTCAT